MAKIACPTLLAVGEYDPCGPLDEISRMFDQLTAPSELWVFADQHHIPSIGGGDGAANWAAPLHGAMCDWLRDRFADKPLRHPGQVVYVDKLTRLLADWNALTPELLEGHNFDKMLTAIDARLKDLAAKD